MFVSWTSNPKSKIYLAHKFTLGLEYDHIPKYSRSCASTLPHGFCSITSNVDQTIRLKPLDLYVPTIKPTTNVMNTSMTNHTTWLCYLHASPTKSKHVLD